MIKFIKKQRMSSVVGLMLDGSHFEAVAVKRTNGSVQLKETAAGALDLTNLTDNPDAVGHELRKHLDLAGIKDKNCAVCLPLKWVLMAQCKMPDLEGADLDSFLEIEAERGFPAGYESLHVAHSRSRAPGGELFATMMAVPRLHLESLDRALRVAQLRPVTFSLGVTALECEAAKADVEELRLILNDSGIDLQIAAGGGVLALRSLDTATEGEAGKKEIDIDFLSRELRITLGQLPSAFSDVARNVKVIGPWEKARKFITDISSRTESLGLKYELVERGTTAHFSPTIPAEKTLSPALALAANWLRHTPSAPEFMLPRVNPWEQLFVSKFGSRKVAWTAAIAGGFVLIVGGAFFIQQMFLYHWNSRWDRIKADVTKVEDARAQIRKYRPWFDESNRTLRIMKALTEAFPEDGVVTVKTLEIRDLTAVSCSGVARDRQSVLKVIEKLGALKEISELNPESLRGQSPSVQFTFNFQWEGEASSGN